jgi:8-oxo-dGTP pyrophosphatase MutT (NUDIX family)
VATVGADGGELLHRRPLLELLDRYLAHHAPEKARVERIRKLVRAEPRCFDRDCYPGHVTASAWIVSWDREHFLLTRHRKLGRWLQLGGHADGENDVRAVALREAREESGMEQFVFAARTPDPIPLDIDVHLIPARGDEPAHEHHDIRFLLIARPGQALTRSEESTDLRWFTPPELAGATTDESVLRLSRKAHAWLAAEVTP